MTAPVHMTQVSADTGAGVCVLSLTGELDYINAAELRSDIEGVLAPEHRNLVLDLSGLEFCDSTGIRVFLIFRKLMLERGGSIALAGLTSRLERIFRMTGLSQAFPLYPSADQATAAVAESD
ncbi:STAS domain-containing protein [Nonomuraea cavernae]|uniref:Anti-sigma factor antagonist n=1 Tax=Nonomuraea cavernae TaxID=2045107 RepID=A0A917YQP3_9ACTN|nr:STAS domain-containing protein [Nonomuraea cavernae]MCA2183803.1 STAS domain-containing protein [Nonomuraea cavernae]GGO61411.1 anti-sigma factor antagonist [Nonomuraea cavernae]